MRGSLNGHLILLPEALATELHGAQEDGDHDKGHANMEELTSTSAAHVTELRSDVERTALFILRAAEETWKIPR